MGFLFCGLLFRGLLVQAREIQQFFIQFVVDQRDGIYQGKDELRVFLFHSDFHPAGTVAEDVLPHSFFKFASGIVFVAFQIAASSLHGLQVNSFSAITLWHTINTGGRYNVLLLSVPVVPHYSAKRQKSRIVKYQFTLIIEYFIINNKYL